VIYRRNRCDGIRVYMSQDVNIIYVQRR
jgi:hypothetical protein